MVPEVVGMFQKEVAERIASKPGPKAYGVISVLLQAYYDIEYLFTVEAREFIPPPKVQSAVIRLIRKTDQELGCDPKLFKQVVKMSFNQRRKTMRNSLKPMIVERDLDKDLPVFAQRPEQLSVEEFAALTRLFEA
jgi:16S rRNA (adenine1518-N6/adenine1519-N6)-dimethyltransferase